MPRVRELKGSELLEPLRDGYLLKLEDNLVNGAALDDFRAAYAKGAGDELKLRVSKGEKLPLKMDAACSSAALVVNTFVTWKKQDLPPLRFAVSSYCSTALGDQGANMNIAWKLRPIGSW
jgi:hypothetical protein